MTGQAENAAEHAAFLLWHGICYMSVGCETVVRTQGEERAYVFENQKLDRAGHRH